MSLTFESYFSLLPSTPPPLYGERRASVAQHHVSCYTLVEH